MPEDLIKFEDIFQVIFERHFKNPATYTLSADADEVLADYVESIEDAKETVSFKCVLNFLIHKR